MYRSAIQSDILERMTFVQNGIDNVRRTAMMTIDKANNGGSFVEIATAKSITNTKCKFMIHNSMTCC